MIWHRKAARSAPIPHFPEAADSSVLALQWKDRTCCSLIHEIGKPRGALLIELCKENDADGVINCLMKFCDPEEYDQPWFEGDLKKAGYPCLTVEVDPLNTSFEQLRTRIQTFAEML